MTTKKKYPKIPPTFPQKRKKKNVFKNDNLIKSVLTTNDLKDFTALIP